MIHNTKKKTKYNFLLLESENETDLTETKEIE